MRHFVRMKFLPFADLGQKYQYANWKIAGSDVA